LSSYVFKTFISRFPQPVYKMNPKSLLEKLRSKSAAKQPTKEIHDIVENTRKAAALELGLPEEATLDQIALVQANNRRESYEGIIADLGSIDEHYHTDFAGSARFMFKQRDIFMNRLISRPENRDGALAASRYLNELVTFYNASMKIAGQEPEAAGVIDNVNRGLFEKSTLYFTFQNRANCTSYPITYEEFLEQRLGIKATPAPQQEKTD